MGGTLIAEMKPLDILEWLKSLALAPKTRGHVRALMHLLFEKAMLWELMDLQRNPVDVVKLRGTSKRQKKPQILSPEKFQELLTLLRDPHRTMVIVAMCTGMRVSEILALRWEHINFETGEMLVQQGVVNERIGRVKTEASNDYIPLDPTFVQILSTWKGESSTGLVFPSPVNGGCYNAGTIQQQILRPAFKKLGFSEARGGLAHLQAHVSCPPGRNWCPHRSPTETHAAQQRCNHHERVRQCDFEGKARSKFEGRANGDCTSNARSSSGLIDVGMCGV